MLPWGARQDYCPVTTLRHWLTAAGITEGLIFRSVSKGNRVSNRGLTPDGLSRLITQAVTRAGLDATGFSAHSLRAGFVTYAAKRGATSLQIARQTRHKGLSSIRQDHGPSRQSRFGHPLVRPSASTSGRRSRSLQVAAPVAKYARNRIAEQRSIRRGDRFCV